MNIDWPKIDWGLTTALLIGIFLIFIAVQRRHKWKESGGEFVIAFAGVVVVFFYTLFAYRQSIYIGQQVDIARDSEQRQLRAYVGIIPGAVENFGDEQNQRLTLTRKNYGQTPAYDVGSVPAGVDILRNDQNPPILSNICAGKPNGLITMFPTQELSLYIVGVSRKFTDDQLNLVKASRKGSSPDLRGFTLVYWGAICYHDAWGETHFTDYCLRYGGPSMTGKDYEGCYVDNDSN